VRVTLIITFIFRLAFQRRDRVTDRLVNAVPWLIYGYLFCTLLGGPLEMNWYDPLIHQAVLIGSFTMGPVFVLGVVKSPGCSRPHS
jgi:hypothetical protein